MTIVPGQWWQKLLAVFFGAGTAWLYLEPRASGLPGALLWIAAILCFLFALLSIPALYRRWISLAEWLSVWVTRALFSIIYLVLVPIVWVLYAVSGRTKSNDSASASLWIAKRKHDRSIEDLQRMG